MSAMSNIYTCESVITAAEYLRLCCKLRYCPRILKNKGAILVLAWIFMVFFTINCVTLETETLRDLQHALIFAVISILLPVAGWLADVRFGWYKMICWSMWTMWISAMLLSMSYVVVSIMELQKKSHIQDYCNSVNWFVCNRRGWVCS